MKTSKPIVALLRTRPGYCVAWVVSILAAALLYNFSVSVEVLTTSLILKGFSMPTALITACLLCATGLWIRGWVLVEALTPCSPMKTTSALPTTRGTSTVSFSTATRSQFKLHPAARLRARFCGVPHLAWLNSVSAKRAHIARYRKGILNIRGVIQFARPKVGTLARLPVKASRQKTLQAAKAALIAKK